MLRLVTLVPLLLGLVPGIQAQDSKPTVSQSFGFRFAPDLEGPEITLKVDGLAREELVVAMPAWKPGHYAIENYAKRVSELHATNDDGEELELGKPSPDAWSIPTKGLPSVRIRYVVKPQRAGGGIGRAKTENGVRSFLAYEFDGPATWLYIKDQKDASQRVTFDLPDGWKIATGMRPTDDPRKFTCPDYDTFADCPFRIGEFEEKSFEVEGVQHRIVWSGFEKDKHDRDEVSKRYQRIVKAQVDMMGKPPYPFYVFLMSSPGGGGLEHLNSTSISMMDMSGSGPENNSIWDSIVSHEFFHLWNVKRLRPEALGPFDYSGPCRTNYLWLSEGVTSYYGDVLLVRAGVWDEAPYWTETIANEINTLQRNSARLRMSIAEASRTVWDGAYMGRRNAPDYYNKGQLLGLLLDIEIRDATDGTQSFDDVMRALYAQCMTTKKGFADGDVQKSCEKISGKSFAEFFANYVDGVAELPFKECLAKIGIQLVVNQTASRPSRPSSARYEILIDAKASERAMKLRADMMRKVVPD